MHRSRYAVALLLGMVTALAGHARAEDALPDWALGPFTRPENAQPIIKPRADTAFNCPMAKQAVHWESFHKFNPAAVVHEGRIHVLYRAEDGAAGAESHLPGRRQPM